MYKIASPYASNHTTPRERAPSNIPASWGTPRADGEKKPSPFASNRSQTSLRTNQAQPTQTNHQQSPTQTNSNHSQPAPATQQPQEDDDPSQPRKRLIDIVKPQESSTQLFFFGFI